MSANRKVAGPAPEGDELDWRWVGEPESWIGLRSERAMTSRPVVSAAAGEPQAGRLAYRLVRSFLALFHS